MEIHPAQQPSDDSNNAPDSKTTATHAGRSRNRPASSNCAQSNFQKLIASY